ncbi:hypothetical protein, partial [Streptomyces fradiae]|uniref:hypothetical protein n=1 Tax=Streptomyces fradiae TaxID=1906 RepID=UPI0033E8B0A8
SVFPTLPDPFSVPFPVRISFPVAVGGPLPFGLIRPYQIQSGRFTSAFAIRMWNQLAPVGT